MLFIYCFRMPWFLVKALLNILIEIVHIWAVSRNR